MRVKLPAWLPGVLLPSRSRVPPPCPKTSTDAAPRPHRLLSVSTSQRVGDPETTAALALWLATWGPCALPIPSHPRSYRSPEKPHQGLTQPALRVTEPTARGTSAHILSLSNACAPPCQTAPAGRDLSPCSRKMEDRPHLALCLASSGGVLNISWMIHSFLWKESTDPLAVKSADFEVTST